MLQKIKYYTTGEEIANSVTHGVGAALALIGTTLLTVKAIPLGTMAVLSCSIYGSALFLLYLMSSLYHALTYPPAKAVMRIFDHCTIFLLITGTYAPYCIVTLGGLLGGGIITGLCIMTIVGIILNAVSIERFKKLSMLLYVMMGWCIVVAITPLLQKLAFEGFVLLFAGGVAYTVGIIFYKMKHVRYMHSVWHLFVLLGSIFQFFSIYFYVIN